MHSIAEDLAVSKRNSFIQQ